MSHTSTARIAATAILLAACGAPPAGDDAGMDAGGASDAGHGDAGIDAGPSALDAGLPDAGGSDAGFDGGIPECAERCYVRACVSTSCVEGSCVESPAPALEGTACRADDLCRRGATCAMGECAGGTLRDCAVCDPGRDGFLLTFLERKRPEALALRAGGVGLTGFDSSVWMVSADEDGTVVFDESYGNPRFGDWGFSLVALDDGGFLAAGYSQVVRPQLPWLVRVDSDGNTVWTRAHFEDRGGSFRGIAPHPDGGFFVVGTAGGELVWMRIDDTGEALWSRGAATPAPAPAGSLTRVATFPDGFAFAMQTGDLTSGYAAHVVRVELDGTVRWTRDIESSLIRPEAALGLADGSMLLAGRRSRGAPFGSAWLARLDPDGTLVWEQSYGTDINASVEDVAPHPDGGFVLASHGEGDAVVLGVDDAGVVTWERRLDLGGSDAATAVAVSTAGDLYVAGTTHLRGGPEELSRTDGWLLRAADADGLACD